MMLVLTEDAKLICLHRGIVDIKATQDLVTIESRAVLVDPNPESRSISRCPNVGIGIRPCQTTLKVKQGYSELVWIEGQRICLDSVTGLTDGTPPGFVEYKVDKPGQEFVTGV
jgi:hypothetical protein